MVIGIVAWLEKYVTCDFNFLKTLKRFRENLNDACAIFSVNKIMNGIHSYPDQICLQRASFELRNAYLHAHCTTIFNWSAKVHVESCNYYWRCFSCAVPRRQLNFQGERQCLPLHIDGSPQYTLPLPPPTAAQKGEKYSSYKTSTFFYTLPPPCCLLKKHKKVENIRVLLLSYFCPFSRTQEQQILMLEMKSKSMTSMDHLIYQKGR